MFSLTRKQFIDYAVLPGLKPRIQELFINGFKHIPFFMALVYQAVRLLPANHPYANPANLGRFGIRHVIAEAANNLVFSRKNIDQIVLFFTLLAGLIIVFVQIALLALSLFFGFAHAGGGAMPMPGSFAGFFLTPPDTAPYDLAYIMLDLVFGVPDIFDSCVARNINCELDIDAPGSSEYTNDPWIVADMGWPWPIHHGLHQMLQLYSIGLLIVATMIAIYFIITIIAETAQTGTPFGKRYNKVWAPIRLVMAFGLLVPVGYGLNSAQYIVLYAAKFGSGFATNGWTLFNSHLAGNGGTPLDSPENLVSTPNVPEVGGFLQFMYVSRTCAELYNIKSGLEIKPWLVKDPISNPNAINLEDHDFDYDEIIDFIEGEKQAVIRFGIRDTELYSSHKGNVAPLCGELTLSLTDPRVPGSENPPEPGPEIMQRFYTFAIFELWVNVFQGAVYGSHGVPNENYPRNTARRFTEWNKDPNAPLPEPDYKNILQQYYSDLLQDAMQGEPISNSFMATYFLHSTNGAIPAQADSDTWGVNDTLRRKGWAGAGIWYNKVADLNGMVADAAINVPFASRYPEVMEYVANRKRKEDEFVSHDKRFEPVLANVDSVLFENSEDPQFANAMWEAFSYWQEGGHTSTSHTEPTGNAFVDAVNAIFGTEGLFNMRDNPEVHPLAQLVAIGKSLVNSSLRNIVYGTAGGAISAVLGASIDQFPGQAVSTVTGFLVTVAMITLTAGFVLYYVLPFLPFIYFFFALGGWVKGIFEAMIGAPLWALAHIRIDGEGLPGDAATNGYFLIFEIFLRPILIIFGLIASILIFGGLVAVMNETWDLVTSNVSGFDARSASDSGDPEILTKMRNAVDEFFFTIIYAIIAYLMGMSSFKLIDLIPNNILRWMGQSVSTFNDQREDAAQGLMGSATVGAQQTLQSIGGGLQAVAGMGKNAGKAPPG